MQAEAANVKHKVLYCAGRNQRVSDKARGPFGNAPSMNLVSENQNNTTGVNVLSELRFSAKFDNADVGKELTMSHSATNMVLYEKKIFNLCWITLAQLYDIVYSVEEEVTHVRISSKDMKMQVPSEN